MRTSDQPRVDVMVVTHENAATVGDALGPFREAAWRGRVVVVDTASSDGSADVAAAFADEVVRLPRNVGFAAGVNRGLRECHAEMLLLLNPDASLEAAAVEGLIAALAARPQAVAAGAVLVGPDGSVAGGARRFSSVLNRIALELPMLWRCPSLTGEYSPGFIERSGGRVLDVDYLWGAVVLVRRSFLDACGGLDERFFLYHEDEDLGRQAHARGFRSVLVTSARARHLGGVSSAGDPGLAHARLLFATGQLLDKWSWPRSGRVFETAARAALLLQAGAALVRRDRRRLRLVCGCARRLAVFSRTGSARS